MVRTKQILVVIHLCSFLVLLYSLSMIPPLLMGLLYKEKSAFSFFYTLVVAATLGGLGWFSTRQSKVQLRAGRFSDHRDVLAAVFRDQRPAAVAG